MINHHYQDEDDRRPVVIFGNLSMASLAKFVLEHDSPYRVEAFTVDANYRESEEYEGLPLVPFEELEKFYKPNEVRILIPMGYHKINSVRRERFESALARGYDFVTYISSHACIWPGAQIGRNVLIYEHVILQPFASVGDNAIVRSGANIPHHCSVGAHAFISGGVVTSGKVDVGEQAFLGVGAVITNNIAPRCFVGAGAVVVDPTEELGVYVGNPARILRKFMNAA